MNDLISKLEAATEGSRELDAEVWQKCNPRQIGIVLAPENTPHYTTSIDAKLPGEVIVSSRFDGHQWRAIAWDNQEEEHLGIGHTEALARRIAALKARESTNV